MDQLLTAQVSPAHLSVGFSSPSYPVDVIGVAARLFLCRVPIPIAAISLAFSCVVQSQQHYPRGAVQGTLAESAAAQGAEQQQELARQLGQARQQVRPPRHARTLPLTAYYDAHGAGRGGSLRCHPCNPCNH